MIKFGKVVDENTGIGVPYATVEIVDSNGNYLGAGTAADVSGNFAIDSMMMQPGTFMRISSAGYRSASYSYEQYSNEAATGFGLFPDVVSMPPVVVTAIKEGLSKNKEIIYVGLGIALLYLLSKKR